MKALTFVIVLIFSLGFTPVETTKVMITEQSQIIIKGKSNINTFQCQYDSALLKEEYCITFLKAKNSTICDGAVIAIKSDGFDCKHRMITKDLKSILRTDEFPNITIELIELTHSTPLTAKVNVAIAGQRKAYEIPVQYHAKDNNVKGVLNLDIQDFSLKAPKKLLGAIVVNNQVEIDFDLYFRY